MRSPKSTGRSGVLRQRGFALVVTVLMLVVLTVVAVGMLSLSAIELRRGELAVARAEARANARLALVSAIGQLQRELGPDRRVSAQAELLGEDRDRFWTGVWSSRREDGAPYVRRDPASGSWIDDRGAGGWNAREAARAWLVSGGAVPGNESAERVELVGGASVAEDADRVSVPVVPVGGGADGPGRMAWWTGDLGVRANLGVEDAHDAGADDGTLREAYRKLVSQTADEGLMGSGFELAPGERGRLASAGTVAMRAPAAWAREHFHDFTVSSRGVLADVRDGGLKRDLTAYFQSDGSVPSHGGVPGISDEDPLFADAADSRHRLAGPRFGVLRDWARSAVPRSGVNVDSVTPATDDAGGGASASFALANESPTRLRERMTSSLQPVLVEASYFLQISSFQLGGAYSNRFQLRHHLYPRVALWNPYNVELTFEPAMVMVQGNGRQEMWTDNVHYGPEGEVVENSQTPWLSFEGGRSTAFNSSSIVTIMASEAYDDPYMGSYYFSIGETTFGPGECLVFSPARSAEYDGLSVYRSGPYDLSNNRLSADVPPDVSRSFYVSGSKIGQPGEPPGVSFRPSAFWYAPTLAWWNGWEGVENQSDDSRVVMKSLADHAGSVTFEDFDALPQLAYLSASLQYGAGRQPRVAWNDRSKMKIELLDRESPRPTIAPDVRTRQGLRLRWFDEHLSNRLNAGPLSNDSRFFEEALFANWNPRAAYAVRTPWENIGGNLSNGSAGGGPWFFGIYTRDLYDERVSWGGQDPRFHGGRYHGNPFGQPQEGRRRNILFELPREESGVLSLGQLQHVPLSEFVWHPSFAIGNSLVDPRLGEGNEDRTLPETGGSGDSLGGFHRSRIGWSSDPERGGGIDSWARHGRALLQDLPESDHLVYDLSFEANQALWDAYFLSSGDEIEKADFLDDPGGRPLPNGRMTLAPSTRGSADREALTDVHRAAYHLLVDGAFNVNSTRVEAWQAMLAATRDLGPESGTPFARILDPPEDAHRGESSADGGPAWAGFRALEDDEIRRLAEAIVEEVKRRGPFVSMADFVNRRLARDETGRRGALQAAIDRAGINSAFESAFPLDNEEALRDYTHPDHIEDPTSLAQTLKPDTMAWGAPGFLTQGDLLQVLAPVLSVRSDSFVIRAYGDARGSDGRVRARAWCEAEVQRTPVPLEPGAGGLNSEKLGESGNFGRRFRVTAFRWLGPGEI